MEYYTDLMHNTITDGKGKYFSIITHNNYLSISIYLFIYLFISNSRLISSILKWKIILLQFKLTDFTDTF